MKQFRLSVIIGYIPSNYEAILEDYILLKLYV